MSICIPCEDFTERRKLKKLRIFDEEKEIDFTLYNEDDKYIEIPYAFASLLGYELDREITTGEKIEYTCELRKNQVPLVKNIVRELRINNYALLSPSCGSGKTIIAQYIVSLLSPKRTLFTTHRTAIIDQTIITGEAYGMEIKRIDGDHPPLRSDRICIVSVHVLHKLPRWYLKTIDLFIVDEAHKMVSEKWGCNLLTCSPKYLLGITATPFIFSTENIIPQIGMLYGLNPIGIGVTKKYKVLRIHTNFVPQERNKWRTNTLDWEHFIRSIYMNEERNSYIKSILMALCKNPQNKVVAMTKRNAHIEILSNLFGDDVCFSTFYGKDKTYQCRDVLLTNYDKSGVGFDEKRACIGYDGRPINIMIMLMDTIDIAQPGGRAFRADYPLIIELCDDHNILRGRNHAKKRDKHHKMNGGTVYEIYQDNLDLDKIEDCIDDDE